MVLFFYIQDKALNVDFNALQSHQLVYAFPPP